MVASMLDVARTAGAGGRFTVSARGQIDLATAPGLSRSLMDVVANGATEIAVDLTDVDFMDSAGVRVLVQAARAAAQAGGRLYVQGAQGWVARVLEITRVDDYLRAPVAGTGETGT